MLGCSGVGSLGATNTDSTNSDEEDAAFLNEMGGKVTEIKEDLAVIKKEITTKKKKQDYLGDRNKYLKDSIRDKKEETYEVLAQLHDDSRLDQDMMREGFPKCTFKVRCHTCQRTVSLTFPRFNKLVNKYRSGLYL